MKILKYFKLKKIFEKKESLKKWSRVDLKFFEINIYITQKIVEYIFMKVIIN